MKVKGIKCHRNKLTFMMAMAVSLATIVACGSQSAEKKSEAAAAPVVEENLIEDIVFNYNGIDFTMIAVDGGTFQMGATAEQSNPNDNEMPIHDVTLDDYYIGETEVTQTLWQAVMGDNPSQFLGPNNPVETINYNDCIAFINELNRLLAYQLPEGMKFRMPTEAEWEYAARGGNRSQGYMYSGSDNIDDVAWYIGNSNGKTHPVKLKKPNELGLYDMSGNAWEWCNDWYDYYIFTPQENPTGAATGTRRVLRGASCCYKANDCRVAYRTYSNPEIRIKTGGGLRLALAADNWVVAPEVEPIDEFEENYDAFYEQSLEEMAAAYKKAAEDVDNAYERAEKEYEDAFEQASKEIEDAFDSLDW